MLLARFHLTFRQQQQQNSFLDNTRSTIRSVAVPSVFVTLEVGEASVLAVANQHHSVFCFLPFQFSVLPASMYC